MDSILETIKKMLGLDSDYEVFDQDIIIAINATFGILMQLGVGPEEGFSISGKDAVWSDFLEDKKDLEMVKQYIYMKVKMMFDPPQSGISNTAIENSIKELEWRLNVQTDL